MTHNGSYILFSTTKLLVRLGSLGQETAKKKPSGYSLRTKRDVTAKSNFRLKAQILAIASFSI